MYVHKREEARISNALDQRGILNVALAEQPVVPALPKRSPLSVALLTLLLAGAFSLSTAFVLDFMDPTFRTPDELAGYLGARCLLHCRRAESRVMLLQYFGFQRRSVRDHPRSAMPVSQPYASRGAGIAGVRLL